MSGQAIFRTLREEHDGITNLNEGAMAIYSVCLRDFRQILLFSCCLCLLTGCRKSDVGHDRKAVLPPSVSHGPRLFEEQRVTIETAGRTVEIVAGGVRWPQGIPADVPPFSFGAIHSVTRTESADGVSWSIGAGSLAPDAIKKYASLLKERDFQASSMIVGNGGSVTGQKGSISIAVVSSNGTATISVAVKK